MVECQVILFLSSNKSSNHINQRNKTEWMSKIISQINTMYSLFMQNLNNLAKCISKTHLLCRSHLLLKYFMRTFSSEVWMKEKLTVVPFAKNCNVEPVKKS